MLYFVKSNDTLLIAETAIKFYNTTLFKFPLWELGDIKNPSPPPRP
jgi:hypothetical protein